jgi:DNA helicase-4
MKKEIIILNKKIKFYKILNLLSFYLIKFINNKLIFFEKERNEIIKKIIKNVGKKKREIEKIINSLEEYLEFENKEKILSLIKKNISYVNKYKFIVEISKKYIEIISSLKKNKEKILNYNALHIENEKIKYSSLFKNKNLELDDTQKNTILKDEFLNLVIAGAGSGKTEILVKKILYLSRKKLPKKILVLAFQKKAVKEIKERIKSYSGTTPNEIEVKTFHGLGFKLNKEKEVLKDGELKSILKKIIKSDTINYLLIKYLLLNKRGDIEEDKINKFEFKKRKQYFSLNGSKVKSKAEKIIFDYFLTHETSLRENIDIEYEKEAKWMKYEKKNGEKPSPDFFFKKFNIYLEHWCYRNEKDIDYKPINKEEYLEKKELKKSEFLNQTKYKLLETYYDESKNIEDFEKIIKNRFEKITNVKLILKPYSKIIGESELNDFEEKLNSDIISSIKIIKNNNFSFNKNNFKFLKTEKQKTFYKIIKHIYFEYQNYLKKEKKIDFEDMIIGATKELKNTESKLKNEYSYILIDEYQDISKNRFELIKILLNRNNAKLFCVGDDWQSIMGFAGSNNKYFRNFDKYFKDRYVKKFYLENNYRILNQNIINLSKEIINKNKIKINKNIIKARKENISEKVKIIYSEDMNYLIKDIIEEIKIIKNNNKYDLSEITILSRYNKNNNFNNPLDKLENFLKLNKEYKPLNIEIDFFGIRDDKNFIKGMTIHKSKGLQNKIVFIILYSDKYLGFPSSQQENISNIFDNKPTNDLEEERRLFYVGVTRAEEKLYLFTLKNKESQFIKEIKNSKSVEKIIH